MEIIKAAHMEADLYLVVIGILILLVIAMLKRNRDRNYSNEHPLETVRVDRDKKQKEQKHLLTEENAASSMFNCLKRCSKRKCDKNEPNDQYKKQKVQEHLMTEESDASSAFNCLKRCSKRKHDRNEPYGRDKKKKEQEHLLTEETDGSRKDTELEGKKQVQIKGDQARSKKQKPDEKLRSEEEERSNREERPRREEKEQMRREEEVQNQEENLKREENGQNQEEKPRKEDGQTQEEILTREEQKPKGLRNQGATCYLNSVLQALFMTEDFRNTVKMVEPIDLHIEQLFTDLKSKKKSVATTNRITDVLNVNVYEQQDAAEFFQKIMNMVNPEMSKVFKGDLKHNTMCKNPGKEHPLVTRHESFYIIPICMETYGMDSTISMQSCFDSYFEPIKICEDDQVKCPTCKELVNTEIKCSINKLPPVLVVQLERFQLDYSTMNYKKNMSTVEIQFQLSVKDGRGTQHKYDLYAVVKHSGSFFGGHYYAVIHSFEDHQWYEFNDSSVRKIKDLKNPFHCNKAYFLLYKKRKCSSRSMESVRS